MQYVMHRIMQQMIIYSDRKIYQLLINWFIMKQFIYLFNITKHFSSINKYFLEKKYIYEKSSPQLFSSSQHETWSIAIMIEIIDIWLLQDT